MRTRSRTASQTVEVDEKTSKTVENNKTPKPKKSTNALVTSIISSIKDENSERKTNKTNDDLNSNGGNHSVEKKSMPKAIRGLPKSGRPWKDTKQK